MECGWDTLVKQIDTAETLEDVIQVKLLISPPPLYFPLSNTFGLFGVGRGLSWRN